MKAEPVGASNASSLPKVRKPRYQREVEGLIQEMSNSGPRERGEAALQLGCYKPEVAAIALPKLVELLNDNDEYAVVAALTSIGDIGSEVEMQRDDLLKVALHLGNEKFKHPTSRYGSGPQYNSAYAIAKIGPNAKSIVKEFVEQMEELVSGKDLDPKILVDQKLLFERLSNREPVPGLFDHDLVKFAVLAVALIGKDAEIARPLLTKFKNGEVKSPFQLNEILANVNLALAMIEDKEDEATAYLKEWVKANKYIDEHDDHDVLKNVALRSKCGVNLLNRLLNEDISGAAKKAIVKALRRASKSS